MPAEATTEGSIVAYLRLNTSDWESKLDEAKRQALELGRIDPDIKVTAETADAIAKLEAVHEMENRVGGTTETVSKVTTVETTKTNHDSDAALQAAQEKVLAAAYSQADAAIAKLQADQEADNEAMRRASEAAAKEAAMLEAVAVAERAAADGAREHATATEKATGFTDREAAAVDAERNSTEKATVAHQGNAGMIAIVAGAVAASIPVLGELTGAAVGLAGGLAGMGAAGVLAILGIKNEMAAGTAIGNEYAAGIQVLLDDLHQLEATATRGILAGLETSLDAVHSQMPALNDEIRVFSNQLGTAAGVVTTGVVTALRVMNPLFVQAGFYVEQLAAGFTHWTQDGGLRQFTQDAIVALPQVTNALGALMQGVLALIQAFSPLGPVLLGVITLIGNLLTLLGMLGPALPPIVAGAAAALAMFLQWDTIGPILENVAWRLGAVGVAADIAAGPVGWIIGAASLLAIGLAGIAVSAGKATQATQDYSAAVQQDNGVVGQSVKAQAAKALSDSKALDNAQKLGISTKTLTDATLGQGKAQADFEKKLAAANARLVEYRKELMAAPTASASLTDKVIKQRDEIKNLTDSYNANKVSISSAIKAYNDIASAQGLASIRTKEQLSAQTALAAKYGMSLPEFLAAAGAQKQNADAAANTTRQLQLENDAATLLTNAFKLLNGGNLDVAQAETAAAAATNTLTDSLTQNGLQIDGNSKAAVANQQALQQKAAADQQAAEAIAQQTGSTEAGTAAFGQSKAALEAQLRATGQLTPAIQALIDKYYAVPPVVKTQAELDAAAALQTAQNLKAWLDQLTSKTIVVTVQTNQVGAPVNTATPPGTVKKFAQGGGVSSGMNYLAGGGNPWQPRGTDTVAAMLSPREFVTKEQSAEYDPPFMKAYNDNPRAALDAVRQQGGGDVTVTIVNKTGMTLADLFDIHVERKNRQANRTFGAGIQRGAY